MNTDIKTQTPTDIFNAAKARLDFPALHQEVHGRPLVYLDNAATTHKPASVIEAVNRFYQRDNSNVHRGVHYLSQKATGQYERARETVKRFINASDQSEIIFTRGATESVNLIAQTYGRNFIRAGDEILISEMEHHSNIVPWQILCEQTGATLKIIPFTDSGEIDLNVYQKLLNPQVKLVGIVHLSNTLGTINPVTEMVKMAHAQEIPVLIDGAQSVAHIPVDVQAIDADFFVFSGHKVFGPTGIGVLYGKLDWLKQLPPYQGGGDMIHSVTFEKTIYADVPHKFEAGTPNIAGAIGLGAALEYLTSWSMDEIVRYEDDLLRYATAKLRNVEGLSIIGEAQAKAGVLSFALEDIHPHDIGTILDMEGVAVRTGHHCTQPIMDHYQIPATTRASLAFYNNRADIDALMQALQKAIEVFR
ncbi:MAG: cysteine desulfurase [Candidatus Marinimicrobia bacterium]|nr:cysteine desulfurase [Candidatus Neomarinimicrobiota bacterium]MCF7840522.1 cysteine desulfurase [Candidatus Neomarinimicrobiota bacterium]